MQSYHFLIKMMKLNIKFQTIEFIKGLFKDNDTLRVSVTALPGGSKQYFLFEASNLKKAHPTLSVNIDDETDKILIVFRKKGFTESPLIASTVLQADEFPRDFEDNDIEMKSINVFEPLQYMKKPKEASSVERQIVGHLNISFSLTIECICQPKATKFQNANNNKNNNFAKIAAFFGSENQNMFYNLISN